MPTFMQERFIERALCSLLAQTFTAWELIIVVDGPADQTLEIIEEFQPPNPRADEMRRIRAPLLGFNQGLGAALNYAMEHAHPQSEFIAYLPSDDVMDPEHLASLVACLDEHPDATLAYSGLRYHQDRQTTGRIDGYPLQLVQVMHRRPPQDVRWVERDELTTDDLDRMFWSRIRQQTEDAEEAMVSTGRITCQWTDHLLQRHKIIREDLGRTIVGGGLNCYRSRYGVSTPLVFHSTAGNLTDEVALYQQFRERPAPPIASDSLKILLVGELAFNPERVLALEERGHRLFGLWMPNPWGFNTVGPLPFGHVEDLPAQRGNWRAAIAELKPDIIYALLNGQAIPFAHQVLTCVRRDGLGIPFVWHLKESPWVEGGTARHFEMAEQLAELHTLSDGQIYTSREMREWFHLVLPQTRHERTFVLDGDLPKRERMIALPTGEPRLSQIDGQPHTVLAGRPIGEMADPARVAEFYGMLAELGIHLHLYGAFRGPFWEPLIASARQAARGFLHEHPAVSSERWVSEFARYDAGWLHLFTSRNGGDLSRAHWDDLNLPARMATYAAAGVPFIQRDNRGSSVAMQSVARELDMGLFYNSLEELAEQLKDRTRMEQLWRSAARERFRFSFDYHADDLIAFFRHVISCRVNDGNNDRV